MRLCGIVLSCTFMWCFCGVFSLLVHFVLVNTIWKISTARWSSIHTHHTTYNSNQCFLYRNIEILISSKHAKWYCDILCKLGWYHVHIMPTDAFDTYVTGPSAPVIMTMQISGCCLHWEWKWLWNTGQTLSSDSIVHVFKKMIIELWWSHCPLWYNSFDWVVFPLCKGKKWNNGLDMLSWTSFISGLYTKLRIINRSVTDLATDSPCRVWGHG